MLTTSLIIGWLMGSPVNAADDAGVVETVKSSWAQWRGEARDGSLGGLSLPASLDEAALARGWSVSLGESYSGPVVLGDRVFVTETIDKQLERVRALRRTDGSEIWQTEWQGAVSVPFFARRNGSWIRATPAVSDEHLYVAGMEDVLVALDTATGAIRWKLDFPAMWGVSEPTFGFVCSPLLDGDHLYVAVGGAFVKLARHSGEIVWKTLEDGGGMMGGSFSSPIIGALDGETYVVVQTREELAGVDRATGEVLWRREIPSFRGMNILTPTLFGESVFTSNYKGRSYLFTIEKGAEGRTVEQVWENKAAAYMSTPVVIDGHAYMHLQNNRIACLDLETGEERWRSGESYGDYWSMVHSNDQILALDSDGMLYAIEASPDSLRITDRREVAEASTWAHLAVVEGQLFVRALNSLTSFTWRP